LRGGRTTEAHASQLFPLRHALDPAGGAYNSPPNSLAEFKGADFYRRGTREGYRMGDKGNEREETETN